MATDKIIEVRNASVKDIKEIINLHSDNYTDNILKNTFNLIKYVIYDI